MAAVHGVDWRAAGLGFLVPRGATPGTAHQLALWHSYAERELAGRDHPEMARALEWLGPRIPHDEDVTFCWGDPRPGNIIWQDFRAACATDFEAACIAAPGQDVGWWLMFDRTMHPTGSRPDGDPDREEQLATYVELSGRDPGDIAFHELFAAFRYAAIVVRVMNRLVARGDLQADQTIWLHNPASDVLDRLLAELDA
jgi:aminoglycoside phosphotransferase (APT) family kinase protein